jgi:hypothetical protein
MYFTAFLSNTSFYDVTVNYTTTNVEAEAGLDYVSSSGVLEIPSGQTFGVIPVTILEDDEIEGTETFTVDLGDINHAILGDDQAVGTILDVDMPFEINVLDSGMIELDSGTIPMPFIVYIPVTSTNTITVEYATSNGSAIAGEDYVSNSGTLTFAPGEFIKTILVDVYGDTRDEPNETLTLTLSNAVNAPLGDDVGVGTIIDDDGPYDIYLPLVLKQPNPELKVMEKTLFSKKPDLLADSKNRTHSIEAVHFQIKLDNLDRLWI